MKKLPSEQLKSPNFFHISERKKRPSKMNSATNVLQPMESMKISTELIHLAVHAYHQRGTDILHGTQWKNEPKGNLKAALNVNQEDEF